jgi:DNA polymerase-3 subunit alpha
MDELFADIPQAIDNAWYIAQRCNLELQIGSYHLPEYPVDSNDSVDSVLRDAATRGLKDRFVSSQDDAEVTEPVVEQRYLERLNDEIEVITKMGFAGYFMIVADFIRWAKAQKIPVGPGRGSGAGSLTAYALGITELDPLAYDLLFERFLNPERVSMPDFDVDFCMERRDEVIDYVIDRYGSERVAQIITHGTMAAKAVVRDVGRVLGFPYGFVDQIAKLIPFDPHMTLDRALDEEPVLKERYAQEDDLRSIIDLAKKLEGLTRNAGRHAGGVVIAPCDLTVFMPIYCEQGTATNVTQFDMTDIETIGLVKFDFLGLRTLTIIDWTARQIHASAGDDSFDIGAIALNDAATFKLIQEAKTTAVFQLESRGMKELIKQLRPDSFEDLIALVALFRPGPLQSGMVDDFIDRKHGRALVKYPHPALEPILHTTYGVILYQEQVMQIARVLAGYTLGAADLLRRAMGKKKAEEMAEQRETFMSGTRRNDVDPKIAGQIFDLMEKFAGYGFNKSHSAAYALVAYQTAWLKTHYPAAFMAAVLSADMDSTDKVVRLIEECRSLGLTVDRPNVNTSAYRFTVADDQTIRYGLGAVKGVGESVINSICSERDRGGPYQNVFDLCRRNETRKLSKRVLEALIKAGPLDEFSASRKGLMSVAERALQIADQDAKAAAAGQEDLFGLDCGSAQTESVTDAEWRAAVAMEEWADEELLAWEKETLGLYLSGHPIDRYLPELEGIANCRLINLTPGRRRVFGLIVGVRMIKGRRGRMAVVTLDDKSARIEVTVYSDVLEKCIDLLVVDRFCVIEGDCIVDDYSGGHSIIAETVLGIDEARNQLAKSLTLILGTTAPNGLIAELKESLAKYRDGSCPVEIEYENATATARLRLADDWSVTLSDNLLEGLQAKFCSEAVRVKY